MYKLFLVWNNIQTPFPLKSVSGMAVKKGMITLIACGMYTSTLLMGGWLGVFIGDRCSVLCRNLSSFFTLMSHKCCFSFIYTLLKDTSEMRTPWLILSGHLTESQLYIITSPWNKDTSLIRTIILVPRVSILEKFHCTTNFQLILVSTRKERAHYIRCTRSVYGYGWCIYM